MTLAAGVLVVVPPSRITARTRNSVPGRALPTVNVAETVFVPRTARNGANFPTVHAPPATRHATAISRSAPEAEKGNRKRRRKAG